MKSRAAVVFEAGKPRKSLRSMWNRRANEVLVKITHTGVCHRCVYLRAMIPRGFSSARS